MIYLCKLNINDTNSCYQINKKTSDRFWSLKQWHDELAQKKHLNFGCFIDNSKNLVSFVCGFVVVNELNITNLAVDESFRKKGIGKKMLLKIFLEAKNLGAEEALLEVNVNNISAINFYKNFGFHTVSIRSNYYGANEDAKLMKMTF